MNKSKSIFSLSLLSLLLVSCQTSNTRKENSFISSFSYESSQNNGDLTSISTSSSNISSIISSSENSSSTLLSSIASSSKTSSSSTISITSINNGTGYYSSITSSMSGSTLKMALYNIIKGHTKLSYDNLEEYMKTTDRNWKKSPNKNDPNPYMVLLYDTNNDGNPQLWNTYHGSGGITTNAAIWDKEHIWAKSNGFNTKSLPAYSDLHHLRASDMKNNNNRSNLAYGEVDGGSKVNDHNNTPSGTKNSTTYEPLDQYKGDVARALFYMATRYCTGDGSGGTKLALTEGSDASGGKWGNLSTLLLWNELDPPDEFEINRNDLVEEFQHNRNPYIDHPEYARRVFQ